MFQSCRSLTTAGGIKVSRGTQKATITNEICVQVFNLNNLGLTSVFYVNLVTKVIEYSTINGVIP